MKKSFCRPYSSENGAQKSGPTAKPSTNRDIPRMATSWETRNSFSTWDTLDEYAELAKATARAEMAVVIVTSHLYGEGNVIGFRASSGRKSTRKGASGVPCPAYLWWRTSSSTPA